MKKDSKSKLVVAKKVKRAPKKETPKKSLVKKKAVSKTLGAKKSAKKITKSTFVKLKQEKYIEAVGRRKTAVARVKIWPNNSGREKEGTIIVNKKPYTEYFSTIELQKIVESPLEVVQIDRKLRVVALVKGGGIHAQAEAVRHGLSRALVKFNPELKKRLKKAGFLTRDPRERERKKFGLKRARRAPQWSKR